MSVVAVYDWRLAARTTDPGVDHTDRAMTIIGVAQETRLWLERLR